MMPLNHATSAFAQRYASHLKHLQLQGLQPKTVDAYARAIRTMGERFDWQIETLSADQLTNYFHQRIASHSWSAAQARPVWLQVLCRARAAPALGDAPPDPPTQDQSLARHRHGAAGPGAAGHLLPDHLHAAR